MHECIINRRDIDIISNFRRANEIFISQIFPNKHDNPRNILVFI